MRLVAHGRNQEMRLLAHLLAGGRDRIGARRQRPGDVADQVIGRERRREGLEKVDEVTPLDPVAGLAGIEQPLSGVGMTGGLARSARS